MANADGCPVCGYAVGNLCGSINEMFWFVAPSMARLARISPTTGTNLKPCPKNPHAG
jgi:hypothetical protein